MTPWDGLTPPYSTIVADPPWEYNVRKGRPTSGYKPRSAEAHYSTMTMDELASLPVAELAAPNAYLFLWVTCPRLYGDRFGVLTPADVCEAWGFRYVTALTWVKRGGLGMGWHFRTDTEHVIVATRGKAAVPPGDRETNVLVAAKSRHSVKPAAFYDLVERVTPGPYVELFCRSPRMGWDSWGLGYESGVA